MATSNQPRLEILRLYFSCPLLSALPLYIQVVSFSLKDLSLWSCPSPQLAFHPLFHVSAHCRSISCHGHVITDLFGERRDGWMDFISKKTGLKRDVNIKIRGREKKERFFSFFFLNQYHCFDSTLSQCELNVSEQIAKALRASQSGTDLRENNT